MGKVQAAVAFEAEYYAHHCRKSLCKHCGKCRSACAKIQDYHEKQIQQDVEYACRTQKYQRRL